MGKKTSRTRGDGERCRPRQGEQSPMKKSLGFHLVLFKTSSGNICEPIMNSYQLSNSQKRGTERERERERVRNTGTAVDPL